MPKNEELLRSVGCSIAPWIIICIIFLLIDITLPHPNDSQQCDCICTIDYQAHNSATITSSSPASSAPTPAPSITMSATTISTVQSVNPSFFENYYRVLTVLSDIIFPFLGIIIPVIAITTPLHQALSEKKAKDKARVWDFLTKEFHVGSEITICNQYALSNALEPVENSQNDCPYHVLFHFPLSYNDNTLGCGFRFRRASLLFYSAASERNPQLLNLNYRAEEFVIENSKTSCSELMFSVALSNQQNLYAAQQFLKNPTDLTKCKLAFEIEIHTWVEDQWYSCSVELIAGTGTNKGIYSVKQVLKMAINP